MSTKVWLPAVLIFSVFSVGISAQDLGSSNSLFGTKKSKSITTAKKATVKRRPVAARPKTSRRSARVTAKAVKPAAPNVVSPTRRASPRRKSDDNHVALQKTNIEPVVIKVAPVNAKPPLANSKPPISYSPPNAAMDELFERLIVEGNTARDERSYSIAETKYDQAKRIKSGDLRAAYGLGNLYSDQQRWEDAESAYRAALQIEPSSAIVNVALSYVLSQPVMVPNLSDRYEEAERLARRAIQSAPSNALAFDQLGVSMELRGIISQETENAYRNSIRLDPTFAPAYAHLGRLLRRRGASAESAKAYENAIRRATDVPTMIVIADVMQSEQRFAESEPLLRRAIENDPKNPTGLLLLGKALTTLGNFADAERFLRKAVMVSPNAFMPNCMLGTLYERQGKYELAENALRQALQFISPNERRNLSLRFESVGDGYMKTGKARNAERAYRQAISLDPEKESLTSKLARSQHS